MPCRLLHVVEEPDRSAYADQDLRDVVGDFPSFSCSACTPLVALRAGESALCLDREGPCWRPEGPARTG